MEEKEFDLIDEMTKSVEKKLSEIRSIVPVILTVVTALIAFFFTQKISVGNAEYFVMIALICVYLLLAFIALILSFYPKFVYKKRYIFNKKIDKAISSKAAKIAGKQIKFLPWDISSYIKMDDEDFLLVLGEYFGRNLTDEEIVRANFLKQKVNELYLKRQLLNVAYGIIVIGAVILAISCLIIFWRT